MITKDTVKNVARLARLKIKEGDIPKIADQLSRIIQYVETINELDLKNVKPTAHAVEVHNVFRDDTVVPSKIIERAIEQAPEHDGRFFKVPKVL